MISRRSHSALQVAFAIVITILAAISSNSQTSTELRAKYGEPQMSKIRNGRPKIERYLVRSNILMTITYTRGGRFCEAGLDPVPSSTPTTPTLDHPPEGDYISTADVISVINELVPPEIRGKSFGVGSMNGGDPEMKLNHPGCWGSYWENFENVSISASSWCWGGTFSATIHWGKTKCRGERFTIKRKR